MPYKTSTRNSYQGRRAATLGMRATKLYLQYRAARQPIVRVPKRTKTRTKTATKTKIHRRANELPNRVGTDSHLTIKLKPVGLLSRIGGKLQSSTYSNNNDGVITSTVGKQAVWNMSGPFRVSDLQQIASNAATQAGFTATTGVAYLSNALTVFVKSCHCEIMFQNSTNSVVRLQLWDVINRRDAYKDHTGTAMLPYQAYTQGLADQIAAGTANQEQIVGTRPTDSEMFNQYYKVKRVTYTELAPGQVHYHRVHYKIMRRINNELIQASGLNGIKGWTMTTLATIYGEPVGDNAGGCTTEAARLNTVTSWNYHFDFMASASSNTVLSNQLVTTSSGNIENLVTGATAAYAAVV